MKNGPIPIKKITLSKQLFDDTVVLAVTPVHYTLFLSSHLVIITITLDRCSHTILQKSGIVSAVGPCVAM